MSYILEALKKSQQERELGQVPTLDASALFVEDKQPVPPSYWAFLSVGLAALAVVIALYGAFKGGAQPTLQTGDAPFAQPVEPQRDPAPPAAAVRAPLSTAAPPLVEAPPPKRVARPAPAAPLEVPRETGAGSRREIFDLPAVEGEFDTALEDALLRQLQAEQEALSETRRVIATPPQSTAPPSDLIEDIEAFKQQLRREQGLAPSAAIGGDPTRLRLTPQQHAMVPGYLMTVHVYDADVSKRFVVINAMRYREGEKTREGLRVEQILKDGAVLSHLGNPFYVAR